MKTTTHWFQVTAIQQTTNMCGFFYKGTYNDKHLKINVKIIALSIARYRNLFLTRKMSCIKINYIYFN